jgi:hypothetical protein
MRYNGKKDPDDIHPVPRWVWLFIFTHCDAKDLCNFSIVSKKWNELTGNNILWRRILLKSKLGIPKNMRCKQFYKRHIIKTNELMKGKKRTHIQHNIIEAISYINNLDVEGNEHDPSDMVKEMWGL